MSTSSSDNPDRTKPNTGFNSGRKVRVVAKFRAFKGLDSVSSTLATPWVSVQKPGREESESVAIAFGDQSTRSALSANGSTIYCVLKVCGCLFGQTTGKQVHCQYVKFGFVEDVSVGTSLLDMYLKTENVKDGKRVFDEMPERNVVSWTSLIAGYKQNELNDCALKLFSWMQVEVFKPNSFTFATVLGALAAEEMVEKRIQVQAVFVKNGFEPKTSLGNSLVNMYSKFGLVRDAKTVFGSMENRGAVSWNGMMAGFLTNGFDLEALELCYWMRLAGIKLTQMIFATVIKLCANLKELGFAR